MKRTKRTGLLVPLILTGIFSLICIGLVCALRTGMKSVESDTDNAVKSKREIADEREDLDITENTGNLYANNQVIVYAEPETPRMRMLEIAEEYEARLDETLSDIDIYRLCFQKAKSEKELKELIRSLKKEEGVEKVYLNYAAMQKVQSFVPDDPWKGAEWNCEDPGGLNWGMEAIDAPEAWEYLDDMQPTAIGLVDSCPYKYHEDLTFENHEVIYVDSDGNERDVSAKVDYHDHGTHVSGIMCADFDNGTGISGVMGDKGQLYYYYISDREPVDEDTEVDFNFDYITCMKHLLEHDVRVINMSLGYADGAMVFAASKGNKTARQAIRESSEPMEEALLRIIHKRQQEDRPDFVICASAGNDNSDAFYKDDEAEYGYREDPSWLEMLYPYLCPHRESGGAEAKYNWWVLYSDEEEIRSRVICVGAIKRNGAGWFHDASYEYDAYSNIGERVDIAAPGTGIYSCVYAEGKGGYEKMNGTSMAAPHVSGIAGLVFAANPGLSGPQVKSIILSSDEHWFSFAGGGCGMANAGKAVEKALETEPQEYAAEFSEDPETVTGGLDLCFVIDTTGSMGDDIDNARKNMSAILEQLREKTEDFRVAIIDYRDYPERTYSEKDYPAKLQLEFSSDEEAIQHAIDSLTLGYGGDDLETVYSALVKAAELPWRNGATKTVILMGDAGPLDPEPYTELTYDDTLSRLFGSGVSIDAEKSDSRVMEYPEKSRVNVFSIGTSPSSSAEVFLDSIARDTGGTYQKVEEASGVSDAIISTIKTIELSDIQTVHLSFPESDANDRVTVFSRYGDFVCSLQPDEIGRIEVKMSPGEYTWRNEQSGAEGEFTVREGKKKSAVIETSRGPMTELVVFLNRNQYAAVFGCMFLIILCMIVPVAMRAMTAAKDDNEDSDT